MPSERSSGLLLHISSLPSLGGIGDFGPAAFAFADFLEKAKQTIWQVLPLGPTGFGNSPYAGLSAFAGNPLLISLEKLVEAGWLRRERLDGLPGCRGRACFDEAAHAKVPLLVEAARNFLDVHQPEQWKRYEDFCRKNAYWLDDYAAFNLLRQQYRFTAWSAWPDPIARRDPSALGEFRRQRTADLAIECAIQFAFDEQWHELRQYCSQRNIRFVGDVAIFVSYDSADVWTHPDLFEIGDDLQPIRVAGVPPDYFSRTGQRWGNPLYRWDLLEARGFDWWVERTRRARDLYDVIRLDHFRGFEAYWAIPAEESTAVHGQWVKAPGEHLFTKLRETFGDLPFLAEDLGMITPEVEALRRQFGFPGMKILQFGFGSKGAHQYLPHRFDRSSVVYTGTHDNDTTLSWWKGIGEREKAELLAYLHPQQDDVVWSLIRAAYRSVASLAIIPVQDILALDSEARMNTPATPENNWTWRMFPDALTPVLAEQLAALTEVTDRDHSASL